MAVSEEYRLFVLEQLGRVAPITSRRMFGGLGLYSGGLFFALVDDDVLFFKVDEESRAVFQAAGSRPFEPWEGNVMPGYWEVPPGVLEDDERLSEYVKSALRAASAAKKKPRNRRAR